MTDDGSDFWVFAYGSLMWDPGFAHDAAAPARLWGHHRDFCLISHRYRGTHSVPGLVLGLKRGGSCAGMAFRVPEPERQAAKAYLWEREMLNDSYRPVTRPVTLADGRRVGALAFVCRPDHPHFAGALSLEQKAAAIAVACGERGRNCEYLFNTLAQLRALGVRDRLMETLAARVQEIQGRRSALRAIRAEADQPSR